MTLQKLRFCHIGIHHCLDKRWYDRCLVYFKNFNTQPVFLITGKETTKLIVNMLVSCLWCNLLMQSPFDQILNKASSLNIFKIVIQERFLSGYISCFSYLILTKVHEHLHFLKVNFFLMSLFSSSRTHKPLYQECCQGIGYML